MEMKGDVELVDNSERSVKRRRSDQSEQSRESFARYQKETDLPPETPKRPSSSGSNSARSCSRLGSSTISSRLQRLATPRRSSSWKKPINSKHSLGDPSRRKSGNQRRNDDEICLDLSNEEGMPALTKDRSLKSTTKTWKDQISPKLSKMISRISPAAHEALEALDALDAGNNSKVHEMCPEQETDPDSSYHDGNGLESRVPDIFATPIIASLLNHPYHSSCPPASVVKFSMIALQREVRRITHELAAKDERILELQVKLKESESTQREESIVVYRQVDERRESSIAVQRLNQALSPELLSNKRISISELSSGYTEGTEQLDHCKTRCSIQSFSPILHDGNDGCSELVLRLREELNSKIEEIEFLKLEHEIEKEQFQKKIESLTATPVVTPLSSNDHGQDDDQPELKEVLLSLKKLEKECSSLSRSSGELRRSSVKYIRQYEKTMSKNYEKIMNYVHEEVESVRDAARDVVQLELEEARRENSKLEAQLKEAELSRFSIESCRSSVESLRLANDEMDKNYGKMMHFVNGEEEEVRSACIGKESDIPWSELEEGRSDGDSRLEAEIKICAKCKRDMNDATNGSPQIEGSAMSQDSPFPKSESWSHFCMRFQQALDGDQDSMSRCARNIEYNGFARACEENEDIFLDALCSLEEDIIR
mmetsp:Transcript_34923/g.73654  ORF Transcript_34923/g.73654 Transcript_34923/m.73654 type:complete len:656 (+) Transcript_34923:166-2133(+)